MGTTIVNVYWLSFSVHRLFPLKIRLMPLRTMRAVRIGRNYCVVGCCKRHLSKGSGAYLKVIVSQKRWGTCKGKGKRRFV